MKALKKTKKVTKKPAFIVDLTDIATPEDVIMEFIVAKVNGGLPIKDKELEFAVNYGATFALECVEKWYFSRNFVRITDSSLGKQIIKDIKKAIAPKTPWYKRFWNWITRKK